LTFGFLRNLGQRDLRSKNPDLGKNISGTFKIYKNYIICPKAALL
jgi:hypothetical protein